MNKSEQLRFEKTINFLTETLPQNAKILDLGTPNEMGKHMEAAGFHVSNAFGVDFDEQPEIISKEDFDAVTIFEVLEHLINPMGILKAIKAPKLYASVPLDLWFSKAYRNKKDQWDQHFHEFEDWQFEWLLEKSGWQITRQIKWCSPVNKIGLRPILRRFTPRYILIEAVRKV